MNLPYAKEAGAALILVALAFSHGCVYRMAGSKARAEQAEQAAAYERQVAQAVQYARKVEQDKAQAIAAIAAQHEQDKTDAKAKHDRVVADLRSGAERLRDHWTCPAAVSGIAAGAGQSADAEQRRIEGASDLVRIAAEWDAKERALQAVTQADRR